jgi:hypothetical protein
MKKLLLSFAIVCSLTACDLFKGGLTGGDFAGGDGSASSPYKIKNETHLTNISKYQDSYFILMGDINMSGVTWIPFSFSGCLDGNGYTIYNLTISTNMSAKGQGMFTELQKNSYVKNITLYNVVSQHANWDNVGAIAGEAEAAVINNCHIVLTQPNAIYGHDDVGGMVGNAMFGLEIKNSSVTSTTDKYAIVGNREVGGMVGFLEGASKYYLYEITNNFVRANIDAVSRCGGLMGYAQAYPDSEYSNLAYEGTITAEYGIASTDWGFGGIIGEAKWVSLKNCKANVSIFFKTKKRYVGGLIGYPNSCKVIACYTWGEIDTDQINYSYANYEKALTPFVGYTEISDFKVYDSYTLMDITIDEDNWGGKNNFAIANLVQKGGSNINIANMMRASNATYRNFWNYDKTYNWTGRVNGGNVTATCPKMIWEN